MLGIVDAVEKLRPRLAVFDCDGTLWSGDGGQDFLYWEIENQIIPREVAEWAAPRYASYKQGQVDEKTMCGEMTSLHAGLPLTAIEAAAERFFREVVERRIFAEMRALTHRLTEEGCEIWAVSSTNEWLIAAGCRRFGIPRERILAASVKSSDGIATNEIIRVPTDEDKVTAIREVVGRTPDAVFGNSMHDAAMLEITANPFVIHPNPDLQEFATEKQWPVFWPE